MTRDEIIRMARGAGLLRMTPIPDDSEFVADIERFAALIEQRVAAAEREACAKIVETLWAVPNNGMATEEQAYGERCADVIRARGEKQ